MSASRSSSRRNWFSPEMQLNGASCNASAVNGSSLRFLVHVYASAASGAVVSVRQVKKLFATARSVAASLSSARSLLRSLSSSAVASAQSEVSLIYSMLLAASASGAAVITA